MSVIPAGTEVPVRVTYLEMPEAPAGPPPALPKGVRLDHAEHPPVRFFLAMYDLVGRDYEWRDRIRQAETDPDALAAFIGHPRVEMWVAYAKGWPQGFFVLDRSRNGTCDLAYFGLVPEAVGTGLGGRLLRIAVAKGWSDPSVTRMTVNTCTLDHPRALELYRKVGFRPIRTQDHVHVLAFDRAPVRPPV
jgi:GNAT superfamily N-acetyltransferase